LLTIQKKQAKYFAFRREKVLVESGLYEAMQWFISIHQNHAAFHPVPAKRDDVKANFHSRKISSGSDRIGTKQNPRMRHQ
jgi:hypothetical protein